MPIKFDLRIFYHGRYILQSDFLKSTRDLLFSGIFACLTGRYCRTNIPFWQIRII